MPNPIKPFNNCSIFGQKWHLLKGLANSDSKKFVNISCKATHNQATKKKLANSDHGWLPERAFANPTRNPHINPHLLIQWISGRWRHMFPCLNQKISLIKVAQNQK